MEIQPEVKVKSREKERERRRKREKDTYKRIQNSTCLNEKIYPQTNSGVEGSLFELVKGFIPQWSFDLKQCVGWIKSITVTCGIAWSFQW